MQQQRNATADSWASGPATLMLAPRCTPGPAGSSANGTAPAYGTSDGAARRGAPTNNGLGSNAPASDGKAATRATAGAGGGMSGAAGQEGAGAGDQEDGPPPAQAGEEEERGSGLRLPGFLERLRRW